MRKQSKIMSAMNRAYLKEYNEKLLLEKFKIDFIPEKLQSWRKTVIKIDVKSKWLINRSILDNQRPKIKYVINSRSIEISKKCYTNWTQLFKNDELFLSQSESYYVDKFRYFMHGFQI